MPGGLWRPYRRSPWWAVRGVQGDGTVKPPRKRTLIQVFWVDATNVAGGWHDAAELAGFAADGAWEASNTGWLIHEDSKCLVLAGRMTDDGKHVGLIERIPKKAITRIVRFKATA